jgi:prophage tail gpP-like protein
MIQIFTDGVLAYDSRLESYDLAGLKVTTGLNKGGTAEIIMPAAHPAYGKYTSYKTIVEIYRDGLLQFRGRALYPVDDYNNQRTVFCEGELCFFQDAVSRPYMYQSSPANILSELVQVYNSQVEEAKQFRVGSITVTDPNDYIRLESAEAETVGATISKLLERCGGYLIFTTSAEDGARVVNWYASLDYVSDQVIEFGSNLLNFSRSGANTSLITAVLPYGAKDETTGQRLTIESVNGGQDYIQDDEAVALRGRITAPVVWDDVTEPANLMRKAQQYLEENRYVVTSLELTALDLSYMDKHIDSYQVGDIVRVLSKPHEVDEAFLLTERTEDLLNPANSTITLGKTVQNLTDADVAGDNRSKSELDKVSNQVQKDYTANITEAVQASERSMLSLIQQTSETILLEVSQTYTTNDQLAEAITTRMTQLADQFLFEFETLKATVDENDAEARERLTEIYNYISFDNGDIKLGGSDSPITLTLEKDLIVFKKNGVQFGWWDGVDFHTGNIVVEVNERAQFGDFAFVPRSNGSLSFLKIGG